ncbi:MAG: hypothetical protein ABW216_04265 [Candidatus Rokuibacteriota bacterium]
MTGIRVVAVLLVALMLTGVLSPIASAQQPPPPAPDMFQETLKAQQAAEEDRRVYNAGAIATNIFLVPGRAITCVLGGAVGIALLAATLGTAYRAASGAVHEGCGGKWTVTGDDLRPEGPTARPFDWEKRWD